MKNGFTLVEILAVIIILGSIIVLTVPIYTKIYSSIKNSNLDSKISNIKTAALKYASNIKDEVKDSPNSCIVTNVETLIKKGHLTSESKKEAVIYNPKTNEALSGDVEICYCKKKLDIEAYYTVPFEQDKSYRVNDIVTLDGIKYRCVIDYNNNSGIYGTNSDGKNYFEVVDC